MGLSAAEKNRRKRERKKKEREERQKQEEAATSEKKTEETEVEIDYVVEPVVAPEAASDTKASEGVPQADNDDEEQQDIESVLRRFQERAAVVVSDEDAEAEADKKESKGDKDSDDEDSDEDEDDQSQRISKRKLREMIRPSVAELKRRVRRPDLVEAHDVAAADPEFLIELKAAPGTVPVPRHWGRKRKYLQGKVRLDPKWIS